MKQRPSTTNTKGGKGGCEKDELSNTKAAVAAVMEVDEEKSSATKILSKR